MYIKKKKREIIQWEEELDVDLLDEDHFNSAEREEQNFLITEGLKRLNPNESLTLRLFYLDEQNIRTVADITGWSESNVKIHLYRGRKNMLNIISKLMKSRS